MTLFTTIKKQGLRFLLGTVLFFSINSGLYAAEDTICAVVKIEIFQELTLERQGFEAIMKINNALEDRALTNVGVDVEFTDANGELVVASSDPNHTDAKFFIRIAHIEGIDDVSGTGELAASASATIKWLIVPAPGAGGNIASGSLYYVGATFSYTLNEIDEEIVVAPDTIFVKPMPELTLDYFLPTDVYADDPLTDDIEPVVPFTLGVRVRNNGNAAANAVKIESAQPKIVENIQGLLINFEITDSFINEEAVNNSLLLDFGNIESFSSATGRWIMETTLSGRFTEFDARFSHADELGGQLTSLIDSVNAHLLTHDVKVNLPGRDNIRDFLVNQNGAFTVFESDSVDTPVTNHSTNASFNLVSGSQYQLTFPAEPGAVYITLPDLFDGEKAIVQAVRSSDGKVLDSANVWQSKTYNKNIKQWVHSFHLFDTNTSGSYVIDFAVPVIGPSAPNMQYIADWTGTEGGQIGFLIEASDPNGDEVSFTLNPMPVGAGLTDIAPGKTRFNWLIMAGQAGNYPVTVSASDGSFYTNQQVMLRVLNPNDTDGDGLDDAWEILHFGDLSRDGTGDFDGDGISDLDEFLHGTNPIIDEVNNQQLIDFESGKIAPLYWANTGDVLWHVSNTQVIDGNYSLASSTLGENQTSSISIAFNATGSPVSFDVRGNSFAQDTLTFYVDDEVQAQWSGENYSEHAEYILTDGKHVLTWVFTRSGVNDGIISNEGAIIDNILLPIIHDFDQDGVDDTWEYLYFDSLYHDLTLDTDNDGLADGEEFTQATNPLLFDTDQDGMADGWEVSKGLNPLLNDAAGDINEDGQLNLVEYILATPTYPTDSDVDNDGIADVVEVQLGLNPTNSSDGEGIIVGTAFTDTLNGGDNDEHIYGLAGDDTLNGDLGNDELSGGLGNDLLNGGAGNDSYLFSMGDGYDVINDLSGQNMVAFDASISVDMVKLSLVDIDGLPALIITISDETITVLKWQGNTNAIIDRIVFANGTIWTNSDIHLMLQDNGSIDPSLIGLCEEGSDKIHDIQGGSSVSPYIGERKVVEGVVTLITDDLGGFFVQEELSDYDADSATSEAIFVAMNGQDVLPSLGHKIRAIGNVSEFNNRTQLALAADIVDCGSGDEIIATNVVMPIADLNNWESLEAMKVAFKQRLHVTDSDDLARYGQLTLSYGRLMAPTNIYSPGSEQAIALADRNSRNAIVIDDNNSIEYPEFIPFPNAGLSYSNTVRLGDSVDNLTGILDYSSSTYRVLPFITPTFSTTNSRQPSPTVNSGSEIKVASFNVLNYFNGNGQGGGFPTSRGAKSFEEFNRQSNKIVMALLEINADIVGLVEIENDGYDELSAIAELTDKLNILAGANTYQYISINGEQLGNDANTVGLLYKPESVTVAGNTVTTNEVPFDLGNRQPLVQSFTSNASGEALTIAVNHFKSKNNCESASGANTDQNDGQNCWNELRTQAASKLVSWLNAKPTGIDTDNILIIGDLNAYGAEDPIRAIVDSGYRNLISERVGPNAYSYGIGGEVGYLDHILASGALTVLIDSVDIWHINADEPSAFDYNTEKKSAEQLVSYYGSDAYRASDRDPVIVSLTFEVAEALVGDFDNDDDIDIYDIMIFVDQLRAGVNFGLEYDFNNDGAVNTPDARALMSKCTRARCAS